MILKSRARRTVSAAMAFAFLAIAAPALAQDNIPESHLKAARAAVAAIHATEDFDKILPQAAAALKQEMIQKNPDLQAIIVKTVDEQTLALAARRADLEKEAALAYARVFSEQDLGAIAAFYNSETGKKLLSDGPIVSRELFKAADIWQRGIARDLAQNVGSKMEAIVKTQAPNPAAAQPGTDPAAPAAETPAQ
ncbi:DUF2059 domain-containing protein [Mesorhizobium sp. BAC0120]|uniref:DUF2059 domain-containing protein n=1 Tax=Mesorhizobium sp. BAC0120 TaxID=3090670 RepID=UPI00298BD00B|nr:DUF2059 domain-containing protein [Mesorhizobium sp. BAC0120]MDW6023723.1 DUF2059 domain-containing protein [Mesorhizobium sp. BAC0120]